MDKKLKFDLDYEQENYKKVEVQPTKVFDLSNVAQNDVEDKFLEYSDDELEYKLNNEKLTNDEVIAIKNILKSRK